MFNLIPTCDDAMSIYTLVTFIIYSAALAGVVRWGGKRMDTQEGNMTEIAKTMNRMRTDIAVTKESIENIEVSVTETKTSVAGINQTLLNGLK